MILSGITNEKIEAAIQILVDKGYAERIIDKDGHEAIRITEAGWVHVANILGAVKH